MSEDIYQDIAQAYAAAAEKAPGLKSRFAAAGFDPAAVGVIGGPVASASDEEGRAPEDPA